MRKTSAAVGVLFAAAGLAAPPAFAAPSAPALDQGVYAPGSFSLDNGGFIAVAYPDRVKTTAVSKSKQQVGRCKTVKISAQAGKQVAHAKEKYCLVARPGGGMAWQDMGTIDNSF